MLQRSEQPSASNYIEEIYRQGYRDGKIKTRPFDPCPTYSGTERKAYADGFDAAIDEE